MSKETRKFTETVEAKGDEIPEIIEIMSTTPSGFSAQQFEPIDAAKRVKAKELYMDHISYNEIAEITGIKKGTIASWVTREEWSKEREMQDLKADADFDASKKIKYDMLSDLILDNAIKTVKHAAKSGKGFKAQDFSKFVSMLPNLERTNRLTKGKATTISEERSKRATFTIPSDHLRAIANNKSNDPFDTGSGNT